MVGRDLAAGAAWGGLGVLVPSMFGPVIVVPAVALFRMWAEFNSEIDDVDEVTLCPATALWIMLPDPLAQMSLVTWQLLAMEMVPWATIWPCTTMELAQFQLPLV